MICFTIFSFTNQQRSNDVSQSNEVLYSRNGRITGRTLPSIPNVTQTFVAEPGIFLNYPYVMSHAFLFNCYPVTVAPPALYYYVPVQSQLNPNQYLSLSAIQRPSNSNTYLLHPTTMIESSFSNERIDRKLYEKYNISFNDTL